MNHTIVYFSNNLKIFSLKVSFQRRVMKVRALNFVGGGALRILSAENWAAGQISLRNTDVTASHLSPGDNHQSTGGRSERT